MSHNTPATVGQNAGQCVVLRASAGLPIPNSPSPVPCPLPPRGGISLTEVLIAMGILTVGLLGVAAVFPVAGFYMQKGETADRGSAIAQAAFNELLSRGMLNPELWQVMVPTANAAAQFPLQFSVDLKGSPGTLYRGTFTRPFAAALREAQVLGTSALNISRNFGGGFVIDPLGVSAFAVANSSFGDTRLNYVATGFPSANFVWFPGLVNPPYPWAPWSGQQNSPLRRVTFRDGQTGWQLSNVAADRLFRSSDDLSLDFPTGQDKPSQQPIDLADLDRDGKANEPLARRSKGDYSWLATVVPSTPQGLLALANGPGNNTYEVSVVVFYKRPLPTPPGADPDSLFSAAGNERMTRAKIVSTGLSGGEVLLERHPNDLASDQPESPFTGLKAGRWIALCGPHPQSTDARPSFVARWYRVLSIEKETNGIITDPTNQRLVTLRGPQWPWQPAANLTDAGNLSNNLCVGIIPGAVAVHAKTIRIEGNSVWSGGASGLNKSPTSPQTVVR